MAGTLIGLTDWSVTRSKEGHRTYKAVYKVRTSSTNDGPQVVSNTSGLPTVGSTWSPGNDADPFVYCTPEMTIRPALKGEANNTWFVEQTFSTLTPIRCQTTSIENPLNEPDRISGGFVKFTRERSKDRNGDPITNSAKEVLTGSVVEFDENRPTVRIEMTEATLPLSNFSLLMDHVNDALLWGLSARRVKLSNVSWERRLYGVCTFYYVVTYEFDINYYTFDPTVVDEGTRYLAPGGTASNPNHYIDAQDLKGASQKIILDGSGGKWDGTGSPGEVGPIEYYPEANLLSLGIPASL
jgi:hypothetical protein